MTQAQPTFSLLVTGLEEALEGYTSGIAGIQSDLERAGAKIALSAQRNIFQSTDTNGRPFAPLKSGEQRRPLILTGALVGGFAWQVRQTSLTVFNRQPYARIHNEGLGVTKRTFMDIATAQQIVDQELEAVVQ